MEGRAPGVPSGGVSGVDNRREPGLAGVVSAGWDLPMTPIRLPPSGGGLEE